MIAKIMRELPKAEVFLTLAVDWISSYAKSTQGALIQVQKSLHIDPQLHDFLSGRREMEELSELPDEERNKVMLLVQRLLHEAFAKQAGAKCYTPFFITSRGSNRSYWFLHLANSSRANDVVKDLHWKVSNHFKHYGREGTKMLMLGYDPDPGRLQLSFDFDGSAETRTVNALLEELLELIRQKYADGISFKDLYEVVCNETPASKKILGKPIDFLCAEGELEKVGAEGEQRQPTTKINDKDIIRVPKQRIFSFPRKKL